MESGGAFVDYYDILGVSPNCHAGALETAFRLLAKRYHPDHMETADVSKFGAVIEAYKVLKDPEKRAGYDILYAESTGLEFSAPNSEPREEHVPISDAEAHRSILLSLYKRRREYAQDPGVGRYFVQEMLRCSDDTFEFHLWYLKEKGYIITTEQGTLAITIAGVDHVIAMSRTEHQERRLLTQSEGARGGARV